MKPIIGIINRKETLPSGNKILYSYQEIVKKITESNGIPIGINIYNKNIKETLEIIDGIILQGGDEYQEEEIEIVKYAYINNIPILGICLGMQIMAIATAGEIYEIKNHMKPNIEKVHEIKLKQNSKIHEILNKDEIIVNSRHNFAVKNTTLSISGTYNNIIEVIEDKQKPFFIGIQWHPESLNNSDTKKLFEYFIKKSKEGK